MAGRNQNWPSVRGSHRSVSKIESADFEPLTLKTLYKFARAFDIDVKISFETFSAGILDATQLSPQRLVIPDRTKDLEEFNLRLATSAPTKSEAR